MQLTWPGGPDMGAHPASEELAEYAGGEMEGARARVLEAHLEGCERCGREVEEYGSMVGLLARLPMYPAPRSFALDDITARRRPARGAWPAWASLVASIVLALGMLRALIGPSVGGNQMAASVSSGGSGGGASERELEARDDGSAVTGGSTGATANQAAPDADTGAATVVTEAAGGVTDQGSGAAEATVATAGEGGATPVTAAAAPQGRASAGQPTQARAPADQPVPESSQQRVATGGAPKGAEATTAPQQGGTARSAPQDTAGTEAAAQDPGPVATLASDATAVAEAVYPASAVPAAAREETAEIERLRAAPEGSGDQPTEAPATGGNRPLAALLGVLSGLALSVSVYLFRRARPA